VSGRPPTIRPHTQTAGAAAASLGILVSFAMLDLVKYYPTRASGAAATAGVRGCSTRPASSFPASATLIEKHVGERKEIAGLAGARRGKEVAALDAIGAALGSFGLAAFGLVIWLTIVQSPGWALGLAGASWFVVAMLAWQVRRWL
jgi:hypothetical protein